MKGILAALGLSPDADESAAVREIQRLAGFERDVLESTKAKSIAEATESVRTAVASQEKVVALTAELAAERTKVRTVEFDGLVKQGLAEKKITPAQAKADGSVGELRGREDGVELLKKRLKDAAPVLDGGAPPREPAEPGGDVEITAAELTIAKNIVGNDPEALKKHLEQLKAYKAERATRVGR